MSEQITSREILICVELYVLWDRKTYGKNHKRISPPSAYMSWHRFARKHGVEDHLAKIMEPRYSKSKENIEKLARNQGFLKKDECLWTGSLHYGLKK